MRRWWLVLPLLASLLSPVSGLGAAPASVAPVAGSRAPAPFVASLSVRALRTAGGQRIEIRGRELGDLRYVSFGDVRTRRFTVRTQELVVVVAPRHRAGLVQVRVHAPNGVSAAGAGTRVRYVAPPEITGLSRTELHRDDKLTIRGRYLRDVREVRLGSKVYRVPLDGLRSSFSLRVRYDVPYGRLPLRVVTAYGTSAPRTVFYADPGAPPLTIDVTHVSDDAVRLGWRTGYNGVGTTGVEVRRAAGSTPPADRDHGTLVARLGPRTEVVRDHDLEPGTRYSYSFFALGSPQPARAVPAYVTTLPRPAEPAATWTPSVVNRRETAGTFDCADPGFCVSVSRDGTYRVMRDGAWTAPAPVGDPDDPDDVVPLTAVSCSSRTFCLAVDDSLLTRTFDGVRWSDGPVVSRPYELGADQVVSTALTCLRPTFCVAGLWAGAAAVYDGRAWATQVVSGLYGIRLVSCASTSFCMLTDSATRFGTFDGTVWTGHGTTGIGQFEALDCLAATSCRAVNDLTVTTQVAVGTGVWDGRTWTQGAGLPEDEPSRLRLTDGSISCAATSDCVATAGTGQLYRLVGARWEPVETDHPVYRPLCVTRTYCLDQPAELDLTTSVVLDPSTGETEDGPARRVQGGLSLIDCAAPDGGTASCVALDPRGRTFALSGDGWADVGAAPGRFGPGDEPGDAVLRSLSCVSDRFCAAVGTSYVEAHPASSLFAAVFDGTDWTPSDVPTEEPGYGLLSTACVDATQCIAAAQVFSQAGPVSPWNGLFWSTPTEAFPGERPGGFHRLSCATSGFCAGVYVRDGRSEFATRADRPAGWVNRGAMPLGAFELDCVSATFCAATSGLGVATWDGATWSTSTLPFVPCCGAEAVAVSCATQTACVVALGSEAAVYDGAGWTVERVTRTTNLTGASCAGATCTAIDARGTAYTRTMG